MTGLPANPGAAVRSSTQSSVSVLSHTPAHTSPLSHANRRRTPILPKDLHTPAQPVANGCPPPSNHPPFPTPRSSKSVEAHQLGAAPDPRSLVRRRHATSHALLAVPLARRHLQGGADRRREGAALGPSLSRVPLQLGPHAKHVDRRQLQGIRGVERLDARCAVVLAPAVGACPLPLQLVLHQPPRQLRRRPTHRHSPARGGLHQRARRQLSGGERRLSRLGRRAPRSPDRMRGGGGAHAKLVRDVRAEPSFGTTSDLQLRACGGIGPRDRIDLAPLQMVLACVRGVGGQPIHGDAKPVDRRGHGHARQPQRRHRATLLSGVELATCLAQSLRECRGGRRDRLRRVARHGCVVELSKVPDTLARLFHRDGGCAGSGAHLSRCGRGVVRHDSRAVLKVEGVRLRLVRLASTQRRRLVAAEANQLVQAYSALCNLLQLRPPSLLHPPDLGLPSCLHHGRRLGRR
mmetsp:Transcript_21115/g.69685  ORF Transcript_21115/g.69685 Transcript_21115/m.69685 type:complete len:462 (-) Transcript_21115:2187-3572(-)